MRAGAAWSHASRLVSASPRPLNSSSSHALAGEQAQHRRLCWTAASSAASISGLRARTAAGRPLRYSRTAQHTRLGGLRGMSSSTTGSSSSSASLSLSHACAFLGKPGSFAPTTSSSDSEESTAQSSGKQRGKKQPRRKTTGCPDARVQAFVLENLAKGTLKHDAGAGEDFFFLVSPSGFAAPGAARADAPSGASTRLVLGIADGVGGWQDQGIDPSAFSQALMYHAAQHAASLPETSTKGDLARAVMQRAFDDTLRMDAVKAGSSTALVASVDAIERTLQVAK